MLILHDVFHGSRHDTCFWRASCKILRSSCKRVLDTYPYFDDVQPRCQKRKSVQLVKLWSLLVYSFHSCYVGYTQSRSCSATAKADGKRPGCVEMNEVALESRPIPLVAVLPNYPPIFFVIFLTASCARSRSKLNLLSFASLLYRGLQILPVSASLLRFLKAFEAI